MTQTRTSPDARTDAPTLELMRVMRAPQERVYRAFLEPAAFAKWYGPRGMTAAYTEQDATIGGAFQIAMTDFASGRVMSTRGEYLALEPHELIRYVEGSDEGPAPSRMEIEIRFESTMAGTRVTLRSWVVGPPAFPPEFAVLGYQDAFDALKALVEAGGMGDEAQG